MKPCIPDTLPLEKLNLKSLMSYTSRATQAISKYNGGLGMIPNPDILLSPMKTQEAVLSSRIEGTQVSLIEVLKHEADEVHANKSPDIKEVINYRVALRYAEEYCQDRPISLHLINDLHKGLLNDVRGSDQTPGQFRTQQNWIGKKGAGIEQARFIPPEPIVMKTALDNLEKFVQGSFDDPLVQLAIFHAQFEIIHPFNDGNGRLGRMLIPLFLYTKKVLSRPMFYLSAYLEEEDTQYRDRLLAVTEKNAWHDWIVFFLQAIQIQAERNYNKALKVSELYNELKIEFIEATHSQSAVLALDAFFYFPYINATNFQKKTRVKTRVTSNALLKKLNEKKLIEQILKGSGQQPAIYALPQLIELIESKDPFF